MSEMSEMIYVEADIWLVFLGFMFIYFQKHFFSFYTDILFPACYNQL